MKSSEEYVTFENVHALHLVKQQEFIKSIFSQSLNPE